MDIELLIQTQKVFSCLFAGNDINAAEVKEVLDRQFSGDVAGIAVRPFHEGRSVKVTVTHEEGLNRDQHFAALREFATSRGWSWLILPDHAAVPEFRTAIVETFEELHGLNQVVNALQDNGIATVILPGGGPPPRNMSLDRDGLLFIGRTAECLRSATCSIFVGPDVPVDEPINGVLAGPPTDIVLFFE
jgi:hypothetical protein